MFQTFDSGLEAEIAYRRERLTESGPSGQAVRARKARSRRALRGRRTEGAPAQPAAR